MRVEISESAHGDVLDVCLEAATSIRGGFLLYYSRTFGYPPSDSELPQGSGYSGAAQANPD